MGLIRDLGRSLNPSPKDPREHIAFTIAIIALSAKMAKSDGVVTRDEVTAFKRLVTIAPGEEDHVRRLFDLAKQDVAGFETYARQIATLLSANAALKRDVVEALYVIAAADGVLHPDEERYLATVARLLDLPGSDLTHIRAMFVADGGGPYRVLGLSPAATNDEVRARRRELILENHPDRLQAHGVPDAFVALAERKLAAINAAYDTIARERGL